MTAAWVFISSHPSLIRAELPRHKGRMGGADAFVQLLDTGCVTWQSAPTLREALPGVDVIVREEMSAPTQPNVLPTGDIDLAELPSVERATLHVQAVHRNWLFVALPKGHRSAARGELQMTVHAIRFAPQTRHKLEEASTLVTSVAARLSVAAAPGPTAAFSIAGTGHCPRKPKGLGFDLVAAHLDDPPLIRPCWRWCCCSCLTGRAPRCDVSRS